ncbi:MAG: hypothetical protein DHS20C05_00790 [Hyphococcus sp.]|nr:MAG: hypothetical protein DHS20C05_00790 [Marinicaulis sp.]
MTDFITIGSWEFSSVTGILRREGQTQRLENRACALLEVLCQSEGKLVSHSDIIEQVWEGRFISPNSVAVVISDIRRALGDDARKPEYIETLPKRGYRMIAPLSMTTQSGDPDANTNSSSNPLNDFRRRAIGIGASAVLIAIMVLIISQSWGKNQNSQPNLLLIAVTPIEDQTDDEQYSALTLAVSELLSVEVARQESFQVTAQPEATVIVSGRLILWDGHPAVALHAKSASNGRTLWSGMASGPETMLPKQVREEISEFEAAAKKL